VDVEVLSERTPWRTSWAAADGTARLQLSAVPARVEVGGAWVAPDTSLVADRSSGVLRVAASAFPMTLNAGGAAGREQPLGTIEKDGHSLGVGFPLELPEPAVAGSQLSYDLGDGIRLLVSVDADGTGFLPVVELADAGAAERLAERLAAVGAASGESGLDLEFATRLSTGLRLEADADGAVRVVDAQGEPQFAVALPMMWDSAGASVSLPQTVTEVGAGDRTRAPVDGDRVAQMGLRVDGDALIVSPDAGMLEDPGTVWPVYLDPSFSGWGPALRIAVRTGGYSNTLVNWGDISASMPGQGTGNCNQVASCNTSFKQRLAWQFSGLTQIAAMAGADIVSAQFVVNGVHSYNCTAQTTTLYRVAAFSSGTTWSGISAQQALGSRTESSKASCGTDGWKSFDATAGFKWMADADQSNLYVALLVDESNMNGWKRFRHDATVQATYNRPPAAPTSLRLAVPSIAGCVTGASRPAIASAKPTLQAVVSDPDGTNVTPSFEVAPVSSLTAPVWSSGTGLPAVASGATATALVGATLSDGTAYAWRARSWDGSLYGAWSGWCEFVVDVTAPPPPTVAASDVGAARYEQGKERGGVGQQGGFVLSAGTASDAVSFAYGFNNSANPTTVSATAGTATISYTPSVSGPVTLTVTTKDAAGNVSSPTSYLFTVATATEDGIWMFDEGTGTTAADGAGNPARPLTVNGASWGEGPHSLFDSRGGDHALVLDGVNDWAQTSGPVVDTTKSFTISAHVLLDPAALGADATALAQDGVTQSGFRLGYTASCPAMTGGCWSFAMPDAPSGPNTMVTSALPVTTGEWVHLVGEHDATAHTMRLWVCEIGTPEDPAVGEPVRTQAARTATPWPASGAFTVGRALQGGSGNGFWAGSIDNVRVFSGSVVAESKIRRLCQGAEATDFAQGNLALDPTSGAGQ